MTHSSSLVSNFFTFASQARDKPLNFSESGNTIILSSQYEILPPGATVAAREK